MHNEFISTPPPLPLFIFHYEKPSISSYKFPIQLSAGIISDKGYLLQAVVGILNHRHPLLNRHFYRMKISEL